MYVTDFLSLFKLLAFQFTSHNSVYFLKMKTKTSQDTSTDGDNPPLWTSTSLSVQWPPAQAF